jgi:NAD-dependent deacetylase
VAHLQGLSVAEGSEEALERARTILRGAVRPLVLTGAGVSAESGVPTFRGPDGLWKQHRPESLATPEAFGRDPRLVWEWYQVRRERVGGCQPNAAHRAIAGLVRGHEHARVITQNVDELHLRSALDLAGPDELGPHERPLELHGSLFRVKCVRCSFRSRREEPVDSASEERLPRCDCGALLRPDVVWFGEALEEAVVREAFRAAASADVCLVVGTSAVVHPAASIPIATLQSGGRLVEINPERTPLSAACAVTLQGPAAKLLPALVAEG